MPAKSQPRVTSERDISIIQVSQEGKCVRHSFYYLDPLDDELWYGTLEKENNDQKPTVDEINQHLEFVEEIRVYPEKPALVTVAPTFKEGDVFIKRPSFDLLTYCEPDFIAKAMLHEASIMELIPPHPNIVTYHGCRINHGRITGIVLEQLEKNLMDTLISDLDVPTFMAELQSTIDYLHSLGLAHNDINPRNIMVKHKRPILIDFGGCAPPGKHLQLCERQAGIRKDFGFRKWSMIHMQWRSYRNGSKMVAN